MNLDKSKKRIAKRAKMGFQGYPEITIAYITDGDNVANEVIVGFIADEGVDSIEEHFQSKNNVKEDEVIQSAVVKMIERSEAKTVRLL
ncbi:MAG: hypothetical protein ACI93R_001529 [Flavobacteriales bacterium]|jgi:hypothetical protein